jgi:ethanolamine utilization protein EutN
MRIGTVVGKVSLKRVHPALVGKRYVLVHPQSLAALAGAPQPAPEELIVVDELGAMPGTKVGFSEGAEAAAPFAPEKKPVDAYLGCIVEALDLNETIARKLTKGSR